MFGNREYGSAAVEPPWIFDEEVPEEAQSENPSQSILFSDDCCYHQTTPRNPEVPVDSHYEAL